MLVKSASKSNHENGTNYAILAFNSPTIIAQCDSWKKIQCVKGLYEF